MQISSLRTVTKCAFSNSPYRPNLWNDSCANYDVWSGLPPVYAGDIFKSVSLFLLALGVVVLNLLWLLVLRDKRYNKTIHEQVNTKPFFLESVQDSISLSEPKKIEEGEFAIVTFDTRVSFFPG